MLRAKALPLNSTTDAHVSLAASIQRQNGRLRVVVAVFAIEIGRFVSLCVFVGNPRAQLEIGQNV